MTRRLTAELLSLLLIAFMLVFTACVKDTCKQQHTYSYYEAVYKTKADVRANIKSNVSRSIENAGKIYIRGNYIFLNEVDKGIHVINNANPADPKNIGFIDIPGNMDIAVKGNILYADLYTDLVTIDITNPAEVKLLKVIEGVFPFRYWGGGFAGPASTDLIVTDWVKRDTTVISSCDEGNFWMTAQTDVFFSSPASSSSGGSGPRSSASPVGSGGSMARFTIMNDRLYTVGYSDLDVFNISDAKNPLHTSRVNIGWNIETIFPFRNKLFIGSQSGMFIYNVSNADAPVANGKFEHVSSCDPVIADDNYAYVTLRSGTECQGYTNQLDIVKLNNITDPVFQKSYPMSNPHGLSKDGDLLFICDGSEGLKLYDASNIMDLKPLGQVTGIETFDVISFNNIALVVAKDGLYQYNYSNPSNITLLSKITVNK